MSVLHDPILRFILWIWAIVCLISFMLTIFFGGGSVLVNVWGIWLTAVLLWTNPWIKKKFGGE